MADETLNIWVVLHNKASAALDDLALKMKGAQKHTDNLDANLKKFNTTHTLLGRTVRNTAHETEKLGKEFEKVGAKAKTTEKEVSNLERGMKRLEEATKRSGAAFNSVPFLGIIAVIQPLAGAITGLGAGLVALAGSAALAGGALGGALVAGISQAIPAVGLLVLAFKQLSSIISLVGQQEKLLQAQRDSAIKGSRAYADRLYAEAQAHKQLAREQKGLTDARRAATRQIQDLNLAEKEAYLNSQRATLGLVGAESALRRANAQGDLLGAAGSRIDVQSAQLGVGSSKTNLSRAKSDASRARGLGVEGNPQVVAAKDAIQATQHELANLAKDAAGATTAMDTLNAAIGRLTPAQKGLFNAIVDLRKEFKAEWKGITDPIINAFTGVVKSITSLMKDPAVQDAARTLSKAIGSVITVIAKVLTTGEGKKDFIIFMKEAAKNAPILGKIFANLLTFFLRISVAAGPLLTWLLKIVQALTGDLAKGAGDRKRVNSFLEDGKKALEAWGSLLGGIVHFFAALTGSGGGKLGTKIVKDLAKYLDDIATGIDNGTVNMDKFWKATGQFVDALGPLLTGILDAMVKFFENTDWVSFGKFLSKVLLPVIVDIADKVGKLINHIVKFAAQHPGIAKFVLTTLLFAAALGKVLVLLGPMIQGFKLLGLLFTTTFGAWVLVIIAIVAAVYLLDKKFHFLEPTLKFLGKAFDLLWTGVKKVFDFIIEHWKGLLLIFPGPIFGSIILTIVNHFDDIKKAAKFAFELIQTVVTDTWNIVKGPLDALWKDGLKPLFDIFGDILDIFGKFDLGKLMFDAFDALSPILDTVVEGAKKIFGVIKKIYGVASDLVGLVGTGGKSDAPQPSGVRFGNAGGRGSSGGGVPSYSSSATSTPSAYAASVVDSAKKIGSSAGQDSKDAGNKGDTRAARALAIAAGIARGGLPYVWGGGHSNPPSPGIGKASSKGGGPTIGPGYDCSGFVGAVLQLAGIPFTTSTSGNYAGGDGGYLESGPGKAITVFANAGHTFMEILGQFFGTSGGSGGKALGSSYSTSGFTAMHPRGFYRGGVVGEGQNSKAGGIGPTDIVPALLTPGEMVLNKAQQMILGGTQFLKNVLGFADGGVVRGGQATSVNPFDLSGSPLLSALQKLIDVFETTFPNQIARLTSQLLATAASFYTVSAKGIAHVLTVRRGENGGDGALVPPTTAQANLAGARANRTLLLSQDSRLSGSLGDLQAQFKKAKGKDRLNLASDIKNLQLKQAALKDQINQNTLDIINGQIALVQETVGKIEETANRNIGRAGSRINLAKLTGIGKGSIPDLIQSQINEMVGEKSQLQKQLVAAGKTGNQDLIHSIQDKITSLDEAIAQTAQDKFQAVVDQVDEASSKASFQTSLKSRLAALGGRATVSLQAQGAVLRETGANLANQRNALASLLPGANPEQTRMLLERIQDLDVQMAENNDALRQNSEAVLANSVELINSRASFRTGVNSGLTGILTSIANGSGVFDTVTQGKILGNNGAALKQQGAGLIDKLSGLGAGGGGLNLGGLSPQQIISTLLGTNFDQLESGMSDAQKSIFEGLINSIIANTQAQLDNTNEINILNGQTKVQNFSSSAWTKFRDAVFDGAGAALTDVPSAAIGAHVMSGGILRVHAGEDVVPADVVAGGYSAGNNITVNVDNRGEGDVDTLMLSKRIGFELKTSY